MTELSFNISNLSHFDMGGLDDCMTKQILGSSTYSAECISRLVCGQMNDYYVHVGIGLIVAYILVIWLLKWFMSGGWKRFEKVDFIGKEMNSERNRMFWLVFVLQRVIWAFIIYTVAVIVMNY